ERSPSHGKPVIGQRIEVALALKAAERSWTFRLVVFVELIVSSVFFSSKLPLSDHLQGPDHVAQRVCRYGDSNCEKKKRCDHHSDFDESEIATGQTLSVVWMRN